MTILQESVFDLRPLFMALDAASDRATADYLAQLDL
jgi:hypothetical protein